MSAARHQFLEDIVGIRAAVALDPLAAGSQAVVEPPALVILRRGILIASLIALESFVRNRTDELLQSLSKWPSTYANLPSKLRDAALLNSLPSIHRYAVMLRRQAEDYETEIMAEVSKMAQTAGPVFGFSRFVSGDFTGNISEKSLQELLASFTIDDCWNGFRILSASVGFGVPSVKELLVNLVRRRHRSAHASGYAPSTADIAALPDDLTCLGLCFDTAMTSVVMRGLTHWEEFRDGRIDWRAAIDQYFVDPIGTQFRLSKSTRTRAIKMVAQPSEARTHLHTKLFGRTTLLVFRDNSRIPKSWELLS